MKNIFLIFCGGGLGAAMRYCLVQLFSKLLGYDFPYGIFFINILGCFLMGILIGVISACYLISNEWRNFLIVGVLGGFTTFSLDAFLLFEKGELLSALTYVVGSVVFSLFFLFLGIQISKFLFLK